MLALQIYFVCTALLVAEYLKFSQGRKVCWNTKLHQLDYFFLVFNPFVHLTVLNTNENLNHLVPLSVKIDVK